MMSFNICSPSVPPVNVLLRNSLTLCQCPGLDISKSLVCKEKVIRKHLRFLFVGGLAFGYFVIFPLVLNFLVELGTGVMDMSFTVERYFKFIINMTLPFGVLFELPVVTMFLTSLGILNPYVMVKIRKYAYFVLIVIAILITPPEFMSDFVVSVPLLLLYEVSISLSKIIYKRKLKKAEFIADFS